MKKKLDETKIVIPPYISTTWQHVSALFVKESVLYIDMNDGQTIKIPGLTEEEIEEIYNYHASSMEQKPKSSSPFGFGASESPFQFAFDAGEGISSAMKHDPEQADLPPLPSEIVDKVASIAKLFNAGEMQIFEPPVTGCNCVYCQVTRAIQGDSEEIIEEEVEEIVSDEELLFTEWEVKEVGDKLYEVTNPLDENEKYRVFLGNPIGCTCGEANCVHIISVLKS